MIAKIMIVLPLYNEVAVLANLLDDIAYVMTRYKFYDYEVIAVDDGSTDYSADILKDKEKAMPLKILRHDMNLGFGITLRDGLAECAKSCKNRDIIISLDGDFTHKPSLIPKMVRRLQQGYDVIIASRYQNKSRVVGVPAIRRFLSLIASCLFRLLFPISGVRDYTCNYRAYRGKLIINAFNKYNQRFVDERGFQATADILFKLRKMGLKFSEVPLILRYDHKKGKSKMNLIGTVWNTFILVIKTIFFELRS